MRKDNKSGVPGIHYNKRAGKWQVNVNHQYVAMYHDFDNAVKRRFEEEIKHSPAYAHLKNKGLLKKTSFDGQQIKNKLC